LTGWPSTFVGNTIGNLAASKIASIGASKANGIEDVIRGLDKEAKAVAEGRIKPIQTRDGNQRFSVDDNGEVISDDSTSNGDNIYVGDAYNAYYNTPSREIDPNMAYLLAPNYAMGGQANTGWPVTNQTLRAITNIGAPEPLVDGSTIVGLVGTSHDLLIGAAERLPGEKGMGLTVLKGIGHGFTLGAAALDARDQILKGKAADSAIINAGGRAGTIAGIGLLAAPETFGGSLLVAGGLIAVDYLAGEKIGSASEYLYTKLTK